MVARRQLLTLNAAGIDGLIKHCCRGRRTIDETKLFMAARCRTDTLVDIKDFLTMTALVGECVSDREACLCFAASRMWVSGASRRAAGEAGLALGTTKQWACGSQTRRRATSRTSC